MIVASCYFKQFYSIIKVQVLENIKKIFQWILIDIGVLGVFDVDLFIGM